MDLRAGPLVTLAAVGICLLVVPFAGAKPLLSFEGDLILVAYLLGLSRLFTVLAALDTGSSLEGMGASREVAFSMLAEPALFVGLLALARVTHSLSFDGILYKTGVTGWSIGAPALVAAALFVVFLTENARMPIDDPNTPRVDDDSRSHGPRSRRARSRVRAVRKRAEALALRHFDRGCRLPQSRCGQSLGTRRFCDRRDIRSRRPRGDC